MGRAARRTLLLALFMLAFASAAGQLLGVLLPQDHGPDRLEVSAYPPEIQSAYRLFERKCSKCHTLARPLNTTMPADFWARYVGLMMHKPASNISERDAQEIYAFLAYDQSVRKDRDPSRFFPPLTYEEIQTLRARQFGG